MSRPSEPRLPARRRRLSAPWTAAAILLTGGLLAGSAAATASPGPQQDDRVAALRAAVEGALSGRWSQSDWSILAVSVDNGDTLFARNPSQPLAPASNVKLVTTAAALHHLGPEFRYRTLVLADGPVEGGVLQGDLILYGTGDPGLSDRFYDRRTAALEDLARQLRQAGIETVQGDVVGDGSFFRGPLLGEGWEPEDLNDWFTAPAAALSFNENVVTFRIEAASTNGAPPVIHTLPPRAGIPVKNLARTGSGPRLLIKRDHPSDPVRIEGAISRGGRDVWRQMTVGDPVRYTAQIFRNVLEDAGISVGGGIRTVTDAAGSTVTGRTFWAPGREGGERAPRIVASHQSPPLSEYLSVVNKVSHNLLAELTLKTLGRVVAGDGSYRGGSAVVQAFLASQAGIDTTRVTLVDGSGLSALNQMSAGAFVQLLDRMATSETWEAYWATLPEAGNPRELRRMYQTPAAGNLRAKTGTIERVSALSGVVRSANDERIAFSIIGNDLPSTWGAKGVEDRIGVELASLQRPFQKREPTRLAAAPDSAAADSAVEGRGEETRIAAATTAAGGEGTEAGDGSTTGSGTDGAEDATTGKEAAADTAENGDGEPQRYRVRRGENFTVIARRHGLPLDRLLEANPEVEPSRLQAGQWITIPSGEGPDGG